MAARSESDTCRKNGRTRRERDGTGLEHENELLRRENDRLKRTIDHLEKQLAAARRACRPASRRSLWAAGVPPASRRRSTSTTRHRRRPSVRTAAARSTCPAWRRNSRKTSRWCIPSCALRHRGRPLLAVSAPCYGSARAADLRCVGAASVQPSPEVVALVVELHTHLGVPLAKVAHLPQTGFGLTVTPGGLAQVLHRAARHAAPTYTVLCEQIRNHLVLTADETGWRVGAVRHWLWVFATPDTTVYAICPGRRFDDAVTILRADLDGVLVGDGWAPYRRFDDALHRSCVQRPGMATPIRLPPPRQSPTLPSGCSRRRCGTRWIWPSARRSCRGLRQVYWRFAVDGRLAYACDSAARQRQVRGEYPGVMGARRPGAH